jgi:hypothetical protein
VSERLVCGILRNRSERWSGPLAHQAVAKRAFDAMMGMKKVDIAAIEAARRGGARI